MGKRKNVDERALPKANGRRQQMRLKGSINFSSTSYIRAVCQIAQSCSAAIHQNHSTLHNYHPISYK